MSEIIPFGLVLTAKDSASPVLRRAAKAAEAFNDAVDGISRAGRRTAAGTASMRSNIETAAKALALIRSGAMTAASSIGGALVSSFGHARGAAAAFRAEVAAVIGMMSRATNAGRSLGSGVGGGFGGHGGPIIDAEFTRVQPLMLGPGGGGGGGGGGAPVDPAPINEAAEASDRAEKKTKSWWRTLITIGAALILIKKAYNLMERSIEAVIRKSLEFRFSWDPARKELEKFGGTLNTAMARVGDLFIPALIGLARGLDPVIKGFTEWATKTDVVRNSKIVGFVASLARALVGGLAFALQTTNKAWHGWTMVLNEATAAYHTMQAAQVRSQMRQEGFAISEQERASMEKLAQSYEEKADKDRLAAAQSMTGMENIEKAIHAVDDAMQGAIDAGEKFGQTYVDNANRANKSTADLEAQWKILDEKMDEAMKHLDEQKLAEIKVNLNPDRVTNQIHQIGDQFARMADNAEKDDKTWSEKVDKEFDRLVSHIDGNLGNLSVAWAFYYDHAETLGVEAYGKMTDASTRFAKDTAEHMSQTAKTIAGVITGFVQNLRSALSAVGTIQEDSVQRIAIKGKEHFDKATKSRVRDVESYVDHISKAEIDAIRATGREVDVVNETVEIKTKNTFDAILSAFGSLMEAIFAKITEFMALAIVGIFLNFLSGGSLGIGEIATGASKEAFGFAAGGLVQGPGGTDRVPAMLTAGEFVLSKPVVDSIRSGSPPSAPGSFASGGFVTPGGRGERPVTMNFLAFTSSRAQVRRLERDVFAPERKRLARNRVISGG